MIDRIPPNNTEYEQAILASIMFDISVLDDIDLKPDDFYKLAHRTIYTAIKSLSDDSIDADILTIVERLKAQSRLEDCGGASYISAILDYAMAPNLKHYCTKVKELSERRRIINVCLSAVNDCFELTHDIDKITDKIQAYALTSGFSGKKETHISSLINERINAIERVSQQTGELLGIDTGFSKLNRFTGGLQPTDYIILAARPSMGKTSLALNIAYNAARVGESVLIFSIEMSAGQITDRMLGLSGSIDSTKFRTCSLTENDWERMSLASSRLSESNIHIVDSSGVNISNIFSVSRKKKKKEGVSLIIIDYLQLIDGWNVDGQGTKSEISGRIKAIAKECDCPVIALSQLNRSLEHRADKRPILSDLRDSGTLEQDADQVWFLYRDEVYNKDIDSPERGTAELIVSKNRNGETGFMKMKFVGKYMKFEDF